MKLRLPIGIDNFQKLIEKDCTYIDKTLFIEEVLENPTEVQLILRPRRFGKTLNMSTLAHFFDCQEDKRHLFKGLNIEKRPCFDQCGSHPVVFISLKNLGEHNFGDFVTRYKLLLERLFQEYEYLLDHLSLLRKERYLEYARGTDDPATLKDGLLWLTQQLRDHHGKGVILLIDEYDSPIHDGYTAGYYDEVINFMRGVLAGVLKGNDALEKAVLTGIARVSKESIFSGMKHVDVYSVENERFADKFGFTQNETQALLELAEFKDDLEEVRSWYNGYQIGGQIIYNPWSILKLAQAGEGFQTYWLNTSSNELIYQLLVNANPDVQQHIGALMRGETIRVKLLPNTSFRDLDGRALWTLLLYTGYLTIESYEEVDGERFHHLRIPNREVASLYKDTFVEWLGKGMGDSGMPDMLRALSAGKVDYFGQKLTALVGTVFSYYDTAGATPERVYHAFVLGLLSHAQGTYDIRSNRESGFGRYDVMMIPRDKNGRGIIIEFKAAATPDNLDAALQAGADQIREMNYRAELEAQQVGTITEIAVAFCGKDVRIREV